jgi:hypothetical protein
MKGVGMDRRQQLVIIVSNHQPHHFRRLAILSNHTTHLRLVIINRPHCWLSIIYAQTNCTVIIVYQVWAFWAYFGILRLFGASFQDLNQTILGLFWAYLVFWYETLYQNDIGLIYIYILKKAIYITDYCLPLYIYTKKKEDQEKGGERERKEGN